jgi:hypothetical protein
MRYFDVSTDDVRFANRWFLDEPLTKTGDAIDARAFIQGQPYLGLGPVPVNVPIQQDGRRVPFNLAAFNMPVVSEEVARLVDQLGPREVEIFLITIASSISGYKHPERDSPGTLRGRKPFNDSALGARRRSPR